MTVVDTGGAEIAEEGTTVVELPDGIVKFPCPSSATSAPPAPIIAEGSLKFGSKPILKQTDESALFTEFVAKKDILTAHKYLTEAL